MLILLLRELNVFMKGGSSGGAVTVLCAASSKTKRARYLSCPSLSLSLFFLSIYRAKKFSSYSY